MTGSIDRNLIAQILIVLAVCIGGWMMLVEPRAQELADLQRILDQSAGSEDGDSTSALERLTNRLVELRSRVQEISIANQLAGDSSNLYDRITTLAQHHGVRITNLFPGAEPQMQKDGRVGVTRIDIAVEGDYQATAQFIEAVQTMRGFVRPAALSVTPRQIDGRNIVSARLTCEILQFPLPDALLSLEGGSRHDS